MERMSSSTSIYEQLFEDDLLLDDNENENHEDDENYFIELIKSKKEELNQYSRQEDNKQEEDVNNNSFISIEGWNDLLNSIHLQENNLREILLNNEKEIQSNSEKNETNEENENLLLKANVLKDIEQSIMYNLEISDEVRDILYGMIESVEYISSLELEKNIIPMERIIIEQPLFELQEFNENSLEIQPLDEFVSDSSLNLFDNIMKSETCYQESLQVDLFMKFSNLNRLCLLKWKMI